MPRARTRAERKDATRARLLAVARRVFVRHGYDGANIALVCREARVTHGALYHHFPSKDALFAAVVAAVFAELAVRVREAVDGHHGWGEVEAACHAYLEACTEPEVQVLLFRDGPRVLSRQEFDSIDHEVNAPLVEGLFERWIGLGLIEPRPVGLLARTLGAAFAEAGLAIREAEVPEHARAEVGALLMTWVRSLRRGSESESRPALRTERLVLRPWQASDLAELSRLTREPAVYRYLFDGQPPDATWLRSATRASEQAFARGEVGLWLARRGEQEIVGFAGFVDGAEGADLIVATATAWVRQGYAREMTRAVLREASARRCNRIGATVDAANDASRALLEGLGFVRVGSRAGHAGELAEYRLPFRES